jgi:hypothetical protein
MYYLRDLSLTEKYEPLGFYTLTSLNEHLEYLRNLGYCDRYIIKQDKNIYAIGMSMNPTLACSGLISDLGVLCSGTKIQK